MDVLGKRVLALMYRDPSFLMYCLRNEFDPDEFFHDVTEQYVAKLMVGLGKKYRTITRDMLLRELMKNKDNLPRPVADNREGLIFTAKTIITEDFTDLAWTKDEFANAIKEKAYDAALRRCVDHFQNNDVAAIEREMNEVRTRTNFNAMQDSLLTDRLDELEQLLVDVGAGVRRGISTGIPEVDEKLLFDGMMPGDLWVVLAPPKRGKTMFCLWLAYKNVAAGVNVLYFTLEMSGLLLKMRLVQCCCRVYRQELIESPRKYMRRFRRWAGSKKFGSFNIVDLPAKTATSDDVYAKVYDEVQAGRRPGLLIVDYPKEMKHAETGWEGLGNTISHLRGIGKEFGIAVVAPAQGQRGSVNKNKLDHDDIAYDFSSIGTMDGMIALGKRPEDLEEDRAGNIKPAGMELVMPPGRNNPNASVKIMTDYARGRFYLPAEYRRES